MTSQYAFTSEMRIKPEHLDAFLRELETVIRQVRREEACVFVRAHQSADDPTTVLMVEQWTDRAAFVDGVMTRDYYLAYKAATETFHSEPRRVRHWTPILSAD